VRFSLNYGHAQRPPLPTNGQFHSFSVEVADKYLGSEVNYARFSATAQFYKPIWGPSSSACASTRAS